MTRIPKAEEILARLGDAILHDHLHLDDVLVTGEHQRLVRHPLLAADSHLDAPDLLDVHDVDLLRDGNSIVQPGLRLSVLSPKSPDDPELSGIDLVDARPRDQQEQDDHQDWTKTLQIPAERLGHLCNDLGNIRTAFVVIEL